MHDARPRGGTGENATQSIGLFWYLVCSLEGRWAGTPSWHGDIAKQQEQADAPHAGLHKHQKGISITSLGSPSSTLGTGRRPLSTKSLPLSSMTVSQGASWVAQLT